MLKKIYTVLFFILLLSIIGCVKKNHLEILLPQKLAGMELQETKIDADASKGIDKLHRKSVSGPMNIIGMYNGDNSTGSLYISSFEDTLSAIKSFHGMMRGVQRDTVNYSHFVSRLLGEHTVIMVLGMDRKHYFYTLGKEVYWLEIEKHKGEKAISELLAIN